MLILGIETSCDETAAAVVRDGCEILSNVVVSQIDIFAEYGGVIPEVAARSHLEVMMPVVDKALSDARCSWEDIDVIAVTHAPGLLGSLLIGTLTARTLAILHDKPLYAVHHLKSHVYANWLQPELNNRNSISSTRSFAPVLGDRAAWLGKASELAFLSLSCSVVTGLSRSSCSPLVANGLRDAISDCYDCARLPSFPLIALVISGGHTQILYMREHNQFEIVGTTRDDAVGECFDKVAKILGLPYPGGPSIARAADGVLPEEMLSKHNHTEVRPGDADKYNFPHPKVAGLDFSFSGLKTAVLRTVQKEVGVEISYPSHKLKDLLTPQQVADFAASFQRAAVEILCEKLVKALEKYPETQAVAVAGGVSANQALRAALPEAYFPAPNLSGDNGAMVAAACYFEIMSGVKPTDPYKLNIYPRVSIEE